MRVCVCVCVSVHVCVCTCAVSHKQLHLRKGVSLLEPHLTSMAFASGCWARRNTMDASQLSQPARESDARYCHTIPNTVPLVTFDRSDEETWPTKNTNPPTYLPTYVPPLENTLMERSYRLAALETFDHMKTWLEKKRKIQDKDSLRTLPKNNPNFQKKISIWLRANPNFDNIRNSCDILYFCFF